MESGQLWLIDEDCELFPNFHVKIFNGHTRGQLIPHINYKIEPSFMLVT